VRERIRLGGAITTIIGALWGCLALIYSTDTQSFGADISLGIAVASVGVLIVFATGVDQ
jgi:hypothetical protein